MPHRVQSRHPFLFLFARLGREFADRPFVIVPIQGLAAKFLMTMKEYPPSQTPGSFNLSKIEEQLRNPVGGK